jgi:FixJ family two-component response regulator
MLAGPLTYKMGSSPMATVKPIVFVVDDDVSVRESLELLIENQGWQPKTFASAQEFLGSPRAFVPSCLLLDISLPGLNGLELQRRIAVERIDMPIIFITGHGDVPKTVQAMKAGAVEFLTKPFNDEVLLTAIQQALARSRLALAQDAEMQELRNRYASLTPREREVMALVVSGLLNKQVGGELGISEITVKAHRGQVMQKMKANSVADLVKMAGTLHDSTGVARSGGAAHWVDTRRDQTRIR